ncbi:MAG: hypothetical protein EAX90_12170 [Candidatus Heimdallarchaeota archaeon]|nr:hypothetical protein [Candidatus Heimdallarchaeota archaeon]
MNSLVAYLSKTGNTKSIAEAIARLLNAKLLPLNLIEKKGRGTLEEREKEVELFEKALEESKKVDLLIVGTPTGFQTAHSKVIRFIKRVEGPKIALFCTHYNKIGTTLTDLEIILRERKIDLIATCVFNNLKSGQFALLNEEVKKTYFQKVAEFSKEISTTFTKRTK